MKTLCSCLSRRMIFLSILFFVAIVPVALHAQGKKIYVGTGTGFVNYPTAQATLNLHDDDTVIINAGKYKSMTFQNIAASPGHKIYIMNSGLVEFNDPQSSLFSNLTNVEVRGDGTPGIDFGFYMHDLVRGITIDGNASSLYFSYIKMANIIDYAIYIANPAHVYDGTNNSNSLFYDLKFLHFSVSNISTSFMQVGGFTRIIEDGVINMTRKLEVAYCDIQYAPLEDLLHLNKVVNANVHHNKFTHIGLNNNKHSCMVYIYGNGDVHHNYISDYWGSGTRLHAFSLDAVGTINVYNNVMHDSRKYSGVEAKATESEDLYSNPYLHYTNFKIYNNTFGNLSAYDWNCSMIDTYDFLGGTLEIKNNIGFNIQRDKPYDPTWNYIYQGLNVGVPDTSHNIYRQTYAQLGLVDDNLCMLAPGSPAIDKGLTFGLVTDDIDGIARPQGSAYDMGAHEYVSGVVYPVSNAGHDTSTVLPLDSIRLSGLTSYNPGGGSLTYKWSQVSGPSTAVFVSDTSSSPMLKNLVPGTYQIKLTVTNTQGNSNDDIVVVVVSNVPVTPPVANAGNNISITLPTSSATLNGSGSSNAGGGTLTYAWSKISGPTSFSITGETTVTPVISNLVVGIYQVKLVVTNVNGLRDSATVNVTVQPAPVPSADAGTDISIILPASTATLNGSGSTTPDGGALTYLWTKVSGPATYTLTGDNTSMASLSNLVEGVYQFKLTVTNTAGSSNADYVNVTVAAAPVAVANAGSDITITLPVNSVALNGTGSYTTGSGSLTYLWTKTSGPASFTISGDNTATPTISNLVAGVYQLNLQVTNAQGSSSNDAVTVTVNAAAAPVAKAGNGDINIVLPVNSVKLDGTGSYDPAGASLNYTWAKVSGPASFTITDAGTATPTISNLVMGNYQVKLTVSNPSGASASDMINIIVSPSLLAVPNAGKDTTINFPNGYAILNGTNSYGTGGATILHFKWAQISGPTNGIIANPDAAATTATSLEPGVYVFQLTVTDSYGQKATTTLKVTVKNTMHYLKSINLYPNPSSNSLHVKVITDTTGTLLVRVSNMAGVVVMSKTFQKAQLQFDETIPVSQLPEGPYVVEVIMNNQVQLRGKFIRN